jgi:hypothetical protein
MTRQHLLTRPAEPATVLLQARQNDLIAVIHVRAAKTRDIPRTGILPLLGGRHRRHQNERNNEKKPDHLVVPSCVSMKAIKF